MNLSRGKEICICTNTQVNDKYSAFPSRRAMSFPAKFTLDQIVLIWKQLGLFDL
jgi:hypothetical protein